MLGSLCLTMLKGKQKPLGAKARDGSPRHGRIYTDAKSSIHLPENASREHNLYLGRNSPIVKDQSVIVFTTTEASDNEFSVYEMCTSAGIRNTFDSIIGNFKTTA